MITRNKINIYDKYAGELEGLQLIGSEDENKEIGKKEWILLDNLIHDIELIKKQLVSETYKNKIYLEIDKIVEKDAVDLLYQVANN